MRRMRERVNTEIRPVEAQGNESGLSVARQVASFHHQFVRSNRPDSRTIVSTSALILPDDPTSRQTTNGNEEFGSSAPDIILNPTFNCLQLRANANPEPQNPH